jgi:NADH:ubiquinone oxidoreductase subunit 4 (subunit M)
MSAGLLIAIILLPILGSLFVAISRDEHRSNGYNSFYVSVLTMSTNLVLILLLFHTLKAESSDLILISLPWPVISSLTIRFGTDTLSLLLTLAVQLAALIGMIGIRQRPFGRKHILFFSLLFAASLNGYLAARDLMSFYVFFTLSVIPLMMSCGFAGMNRKGDGILRFFAFNMFGSFLLLCATTASFLISVAPDEGVWKNPFELHSAPIFGCVFVALVFRLPVWPFYKAVSPALKNIHNPLVFINLNLLPMTGIYGLIRFWSDEHVEHLPKLLPFFGALCLLSMLISAVYGVRQRSLRAKLFAYMLIYNLLYLSAVFLPTDVLKMNIGYSLFSFLLLISLLSVLVFHIRTAKVNNPHLKSGILCLLPRAAFVYAVAMLAAIGLPITALFWNNFMILSQIFEYDLRIGCVVMLSLTAISAALLSNWYDLKKRTCFEPTSDRTKDLDLVQFISYWGVMMILFLSFIKPLWFVF